MAYCIVKEKLQEGKQPLTTVQLLGGRYKLLLEYQFSPLVSSTFSALCLHSHSFRSSSPSPVEAHVAGELRLRIPSSLCCLLPTKAELKTEANEPFRLVCSCLLGGPKASSSGTLVSFSANQVILTWKMFIVFGYDHLHSFLTDFISLGPSSALRKRVWDTLLGAASLADLLTVQIAFARKCLTLITNPTDLHSGDCVIFLDSPPVLHIARDVFAKHPKHLSSRMSFALQSIANCRCYLHGTTWRCGETPIAIELYSTRFS